MQSTSRQPRKWTLAEDQKLREEVETQLMEGGDVKDWCRIATQLPGRTNKDCRKRWHNSVAGGLKKGQWSKSEDQLLARGVQQFGQRWTLVANCVESRSADQCAKRWQQSLDPELDRSEWREEEDKILIEATQQLGRHWKDIQREHFPGRSKNCIKNRYTVLVRRYQNQGITLPSRGSSPSEASTPAPISPYAADDDEYLQYSTDPYGNLLPPQAPGTSSSHRSWPSFDSEALPWTSAQGYNASIPAVTSDLTHATSCIPDFTFTQPPALDSNIASPSAGQWHWPSAPLDPSSSMHARSAVSYGTTSQFVAPHYDAYSMSRQAMSSTSRSYSISPGRSSYPPLSSAPATNVSRSSSWPEQQQQQQHYDSLSQTNYQDPRLVQNPFYRF